jgi:hypothetical protein
MFQVSFMFCFCCGTPRRDDDEYDDDAWRRIRGARMRASTAATG